MGRASHVGAGSVAAWVFQADGLASFVVGVGGDGIGAALDALEALFCHRCQVSAWCGGA